MGKRKYFWDFWKFIAAIGVIMVHAPFAGNLGKVMTCVGTWGVGYFALISGYACFGDSSIMSRKILKRFARNGLITLVTVALYLAFSYFAMRREHLDILWKLELRKPVTYLKMIFAGDFEFFYGSALWYMVGLLYCYIIFYFLVRFKLKKVIYVMLPVFIVLRIVVDSYVNSFNANWHWSGNALVGVLPMMLIGYVLADQKERLIKIPAWVLITGAVLTAAAMFVLVCVKVGKLDISQPFKMLCAAFVFTIGIKKPNWSVIKPLAFLGREDSLYIYLFHFMILVLLAGYMYSKPVSGKIVEWQLPIAVIIASVIFARILSMIISLIKILIKKLVPEKNAC